MNESAAKSLRGASTQPFNLEEFEQRLKGPQPRPPGADPLVELADLVNSAEDPFKDLFSDPAVAKALTGEGAAARRPPAPQAPSAPPAPSVAEVEAADPLAGYPDDGPAMLRSYAEQMRAPAPVSHPPLPAAFEPPPPAPAAKQAVRPPAPAPAQIAAPAPQAPQAPQAQEAQAQEPQAQESADDYFAAPALRGTLPAGGADPVDEFERSIVQLVAARTADEAAAASALAPPAAAPPAAPAAAPQLRAATPPAAPVNPFALPQDHQPAAPAYAPQDPMNPADPQQGRYPQDDHYPQDDRYPQADPYAREYTGGYPNNVNSMGLNGDADGSGVRPAIPPEWLADGEEGDHPSLKGGGGRSRKPMYLMGGALAVMVVGIGATLAMRNSFTGDGSIPTITASGDKMKVKPEAAPAKPVRTVSVLQSGDGDQKASKVVSNGEQPIDLAQVPDEPKKARRIKEEELSKKLNLADRNLRHPISSLPPKIQPPRRAGGYFPEPRKVRTVMVRPDGSLIDPTASIPVKPAQRAAVAPPSRAVPAATPATRWPNVGSQPSSRTASAAPSSRKTASRATPAPRPQPAARQRSAAIDLTATRTRAASSSGGGYAVQLAAPASVSAARSVAGKMKARFGSVFGGRTPSVQKAVVKSRTVYRVRVTGLDRSGASRMCSQVKAKGGSCFIARN